MSNLKSRVAKLENKQLPPRPTWKDLVTGRWSPSEFDWCEFLGGSEEYVKMQAWADSFTEEEHERIQRIKEGGKIDKALSARLLNVPESLKPILDELAEVIHDTQNTDSKT